MNECCKNDPLQLKRVFSLLLCIWCCAVMPKTSIACLAYSQLFCSLGQVQQNDETTYNAEVGSFTHAHTRRQVFLFFDSWQLMFIFVERSLWYAALHCWLQGANGWDPLTHTLRLNNLLAGKGDSSKSSNSKVLSWKVDLFSYLFLEGFFIEQLTAELQVSVMWPLWLGTLKRGRCIAPGDGWKWWIFYWNFTRKVTGLKRVAPHFEMYRWVC